MPASRNRVLSFMSQWGGASPRSVTPDHHEKIVKSPPSPPANDFENEPLKHQRPPNVDTASPHPLQSRGQVGPPSPRSPITPSRARGDSRATSRPMSMIQTYQPPQVEVAQDTPPELQPIFTFLNSHSNKLYQEGYFLKLHDLDSRGRPSPDRVWNECFAQLVGTVLSLWDAAALDQAGEDGEVVPTFINLSDASIKMIESLPMNGAQGGSLQNVLSISTAANNRYLLHFNSLNSLTQWTAGIRLAMFEHSTLQEAYTGSLIAGKGRYLNNIRQIMDRSKFAYEDWTRVRFGAGTPWKRCWCVIAPPDEKEYQKAQKVLKKASTYSRAQMPKGSIKFYDTRKVTKKTQPIATIADAFAAYAIYPQSKPLIDQSTLVKLEGLITIHGERETTTEGFVFAMPEAHAAVSGFEMMLRWLFPVFDTFALYGRPARLIADTLDQRGLMFAMPRDRRYGYLDTLDVSTLIHTDGSQNWSERQWRKEMKKLTSTRMTTQMEDSPRPSRQLGPRRNTQSRASLPPTRSGVQFQEPSIHSSPGSRSGSPGPAHGVDNIKPPKRTDSAPPQTYSGSPHKRAASEAHGYWKHRTETPSRLSQETHRPGDYNDQPPAPPRHGGALGGAGSRPSPTDALQRMHSGDRSDPSSSYEQVATRGTAPNLPPPAPVISPPAMMHNPNSRPPVQPYQAPELRRAHSNVDAATLYELQHAVRPAEESDAPSAQHPHDGMQHENLPYRDQRGVFPTQPSDIVGYADDGSGWQHWDAKQRLSTIPGSPYMGQDGEYFQPTQEMQMPQMDGVMDAGNEQSHGRPELTQTRSSRSVARKPLPTQKPQGRTEADAPRQDQASQVRAMEPDLPDSPVSGVFFDAVVDQDALERILNDSERTSTSASSATPDYRSVESTSEQHPKKEKEWRRPGKLKTVGDPDLPVIDVRSGGAGRLDTYNQTLAEQSAEMPAVDFGPTYTYKPTSRPGTSGTLSGGETGKARSRSRSADKLRQSSGSRLSGYYSTPSPGENSRISYSGGRATPTGVDEADLPRHGHSVAWTPGLVSGATSPGALQQRQTLSPEEWVQYRAALAAQPQAPQRKSPVPTFAHQRQVSMSNVQQQRHSMTRTPPPLVRNGSGDWSQAQFHTPPSRPNSRGVEAYLNPGAGGGLVTNQSTPTLTAKEQMHIARATGAPLLDMSSRNKRAEEQSPGLVGALAAREREKAALAQGIRSNMVQQAIMARQQQQAQMEAEAQARAQYEMQERALAETQALHQQQQQLAYRHSMIGVPQANYQQQAAPSMYGHGRTQSMQLPVLQNMGGYGGQFVQQQGIVPQQQAPSGSYYNMQQGAQGQQQWQQQPRR